MCIAVYKPAGQKMPSKKIFSNCFSSNNDGAGFMFPYDGKVHYEKGFMSFTAFKKGLKAAIKKYGIDTKDAPMVFHFRIQSQGGVKPELTHPFPVCRSYDQMRKLTGDVDLCCVHNGIIDFASSFKAIDYSDTMEFIKEIAFPLTYKKETTYYKNKTLMDMMRYLLSGNRFAIMDKTGHVELIGAWIEDNGIFYSNTSYEGHYFTKTSSLTKDWYKSTVAPLYDDGYDYSDYYDDYYYSGYISKEQEKEFLETGMLRCDCGEELLIEYVKSEARCYAFCFDCGLSYKLTDKAEDYAWEHGLVVCDYEDEQKMIDDYNEGYGVNYDGSKR